MPQDFGYRTATSDDALTLSVLATQVFLDTYATRGIDTDLAKEASTIYSPAEFLKRLQDPNVEITAARAGNYLIGFLDLASNTRCPVASIEGFEVMRLYVQAPFQRCGIGRQLMALAETRARDRKSPQLWLTAWAGNARALAFYPSIGYEDIGSTPYVIEGKEYENRVFVKRIALGAA